MVKSITPYRLATLSQKLQVDYPTSPADTIQMPMYAINLSALAWQGGVSTPTIGRFCTVPVYRHVKTGNLDVTTPQYAWERVNNTINAINQPAANTSGWQFVWNRKETDAVTTCSPFYRHLWSNIKLLFQCGTYCSCTIHTDVVRFQKKCGPRRQYWDTVENTMRYMDAAPDQSEQNEMDVFWESYYAPRVTHPLAEYHQTEKDTFIKHIAKGAINVQMLETSNTEQPRHIREIFFKNGAVYSLKDESHQDEVNIGTLANQDYQHNPVAVSNHILYPNLTNMIPSQDRVLPYNRNENEDVWLIIHADMHARDTAAPCSFDFTITNKYVWSASGETAVHTTDFTDGGPAPAFA